MKSLPIDEAAKKRVFRTVENRDPEAPATTEATEPTAPPTTPVPSETQPPAKKNAKPATKSATKK